MFTVTATYSDGRSGIVDTFPTLGKAKTVANDCVTPHGVPDEPRVVSAAVYTTEPYTLTDHLPVYTIKA